MGATDCPGEYAPLSGFAVAATVLAWPLVDEALEGCAVVALAWLVVAPAWLVVPAGVVVLIDFPVAAVPAWLPVEAVLNGLAVAAGLVWLLVAVVPECFPVVALTGLVVAGGVGSVVVVVVVPPECFPVWVVPPWLPVVVVPECLPV